MVVEAAAEVDGMGAEGVAGAAVAADGTVAVVAEEVA